MANRVAGVCYIKIDGTQYTLKGKLTYQPLTTEKTNVTGQDGPHGYKEMPISPFIKGTFTDLGGVSVQQLQNLTASTITAELANGKTIIVNNGWLEGKVEVNTEEGEYEAQFNGMSAIEQTPTA